ncbi:unnamed protein product [Nezara viridula]|uniref:Nucleoporin Nup54 n=1 Tax=Nezara viridula TaxID=85310 RepID=A0A9P0MRX7_NEZVI|nr:unnamed protein product [Nezara viridula]
MAFNFGTTPTFGTSTTTASSFGFGTNTTASKPATGFGTTSFSFGTASTGTTGFGTTTTTTAPGFGGFGTTFGTATTQQPNFGFGTPSAATTTASTGFGGFGTSTFGTATTTTPSLFSGFGQSNTTPSTGFANFGTKPIGTGFGSVTSTGIGSGGLGSGLTQVAQQPQQSSSELEVVLNSVYNCCMFGDERDEVLAKWNLLQASWGTGKGFYNPNAPPAEYTPQNPFYRFKAIVYSVKPTVEPRDGFVALQFNKKEEEIRNQDQQLGQGLAAIFGLSQRLNLTLHVDTIRPISASSTLVFIFMEEKSSNGQIKRISNQELASFLLQPTQVNQLKQMGVTDCYPFSCPDKDQIQEYLDNSPAGIDPLMWKQAQADNPDPVRLIPMPLLGFSELRWRYHCQVEETKRHTAFLDSVAEEILKIKSANEAARLKINEYKQKVIELEHRVLEVMVRQQIARNFGVALRPEEEMLRSQLDAVQSQLSSPQFAGRLSELQTQVRLHKQEVSQQSSDNYNMNPAVKDEIKQFLLMQQDAIKSVLDIMQNDEADLKILENDLSKFRSRISANV